MQNAAVRVTLSTAGLWCLDRFAEIGTTEIRVGVMNGVPYTNLYSNDDRDVEETGGFIPMPEDIGSEVLPSIMIALGFREEIDDEADYLLVYLRQKLEALRVQ